MAVGSAGWKSTLSVFNAMKTLNKYGEMYAQCNRSLSGESLLTPGPLQGSCGQAGSRNADRYPKGSGLRVCSSFLFFYPTPKTVEGLGLLKQKVQISIPPPFSLTCSSQKTCTEPNHNNQVMETAKLDLDRHRTADPLSIAGYLDPVNKARNNLQVCVDVCHRDLDVVLNEIRLSRPPAPLLHRPT